MRASMVGVTVLVWREGGGGGGLAGQPGLEHGNGDALRARKCLNGVPTCYVGPLLNTVVELVPSLTLVADA
jgi:hypothetical protein